MESLVIAEVEIDGNNLLHFSDIFLSQRFNQHHEFSIRISHDVVESSGSFGLDNAKNMIGKNAIIKFTESTGTSSNTAYEFKGIVCEIGLLQSGSVTGDLIIKGFSPTILLEDGPRMASFNDKTLRDIVSEIIKPGLSKVNGQDDINPKFSDPVKYICLYKESTFHFINRLSAAYGEFFYYDGAKLLFGHPSTTDVEVIYGEDITYMQMSMHVEPIEIKKYSYISKEHDFIHSTGTTLTDLDNHTSHLVNVSNDLYDEIDDIPLLQRVQSKPELENFINHRKEAIAAGLVVLKATCTNPNLSIGKIANVKVASRRFGPISQIEDYGRYLVTTITHHITGSGKYYNNFEGFPASVKTIPVQHAVMPKGVPEPAKVIDNKDPEKLSRVRVRFLWQNDQEKTDWIWALAPDAGSGKDGAAGGGFVFVPQVDDLVLIGFIYNNPDRPFIMGSMFQGKSAAAGTSRCITGRKSTAKVCIDDAKGSVNIFDGKGNKITLDGEGNINIKSETTICLNVGTSEIKIEASKITIKATDVKVDASNADIQGSSKAVLKKDDSTYFKAEGTKVTMEAANAEVKGGTEAKLNGTHAIVNGTGKTDITGTTVNIN